ncbi:hypothetical protein Glove_299g35 [Diversispora epigaea]|uniref:Proteasome subunit beta n=1 Tax=Diversispora epigaea TaxID=1348612 RepID=A0A397HX27_9GLOM|nr:hypothetical protein Glove_299g35 [Diversispora epigaea]
MNFVPTALEFDTYGQNGQNGGVPTSLYFDPYDNNGGTALGLSGEDYSIVASDTRQSSGFDIYSRCDQKATKLTENSVLALGGFRADGRSLTKRIIQRMEWYRHAHEKEMSFRAISQLLSVTLYSRRFFPYYAFSLLGGLDENGKGVVCSFDSVGSYHDEPSCVVGSGSALMQSFVDNQIAFHNQQVNNEPISLEKAIRIVKDSFDGVAERDIYTGDSLDIFIITRDGVTTEQYPLRKD